jgi:metallo-beta-lactamase family protein
MKIAFHGAARTVTGSKHLISLQNGKKYLLDCGMFQGMGPETDDLNRTWGFKPEEVSHLIVSHAHIDHTGLIPKLVKDGFKGRIFSTPATRELTEVLLADSARIQEEDIRFANKKRIAEGRAHLQPMYDENDASIALTHFETVPYDTWYAVDDCLQLMYSDAGHIVGSAAVHLKIKENGKEYPLTFSGDVGRYTDVILRSPSVFPQADFILIESTYGNSLHDADVSTPDLLWKWIDRTCMQKKGKLIIPAFSVGRTQEILFALNQLEMQNRLPDTAYFVDSPLSIKVTEIVKKYENLFNDHIQQVLKSEKDPFTFQGLKYIQSVADSKALNFRQEPCVIISASGMAEAGRVKHHISNSIENSHNSILLVGYCEPRSLGGKLMAGAKEVGIYGVTHEVHAEVGSIRSMSAHGDYKDLIHFLACQDPKLVKKLFLVHGDYEVQQAFREKLSTVGFGDISIPERHSEVDLA